MTHLCNCKPKSWRSSFVAISQHYLPAHNERDNEELITHVARRPEGLSGPGRGAHFNKRETTVLEHARRGLRAVTVVQPGSNTLRPKRLPKG
jgi:hypothetical protein